VSLTAGMRVGPYEIHSLLGRGGMGEVYRAHDSRLHRDVAVKVLAPSLGADPEAVARFEREARAVAALNHPNIVSLHDVGREGDVVFAVTELLEGETVRGLLVDITRPPLRQVLDIGVQVARGVGAAHAQGIVHRDLKPENLFLTADRRVKVLDFGLAARRQPISGLETLVETSPGLVVGTIGYMAPEVVRGEPATAASDTFAFGVVLYELLTGVHPFERETAAETLAAIMRDDPPRLSRVAPGTPPPLARLVDRCLQKAPADRPESMRDVAFYLENVDTSSGGVVTGPGAAAAGTAAAAGGARRTIVTAATAVLGLLALTWGLFWWSERRYGALADGDGLRRAPAYVAHVQQGRIARLQVAASAFAATSNVRSLLETTHGPTAMASLEDYQTGLADPVVLVLLTPEGELLARTGGSAVAGASESADWRRLMTLPDRAGTLLVAGQPYHAAGATVEAAGSVFGTVIAASPVDDRFARDVRELTAHDVVLLDASGVRGSTIRREAVPWSTLGAWRAAGGGTDRAVPVQVAGQPAHAREVPLSLSAQVTAVLIDAAPPASGPYQALRLGVLVAALAVLAVTAVLTRGLRR
jgi:hypothetical protein